MAHTNKEKMNALNEMLHNKIKSVAAFKKHTSLNLRMYDSVTELDGEFLPDHAEKIVIHADGLTKVDISVFDMPSLRSMTIYTDGMLDEDDISVPEKCTVLLNPEAVAAKNKRGNTIFLKPGA